MFQWVGGDSENCRNYEWDWILRLACTLTGPMSPNELELYPLDGRDLKDRVDFTRTSPDNLGVNRKLCKWQQQMLWSSAVLKLLCNLESLTELIKDREAQACWNGMGRRPLDFCQCLQMIPLLLFFFFLNNVIYWFLAVPGPCCCMDFSLVVVSGVLSSCSVQASHCGDFSFYRAQALGWELQ